jgi:flagellar hook-associated protein 2
MNINAYNPYAPAGSTGLPANVGPALAKALLARNPDLQKIDAQVRSSDARLSLVGTLASALAEFRAGSGGLAAGNLGKAVSVSGAGLAATLNSGSAAAGSYQVSVEQLATAQQLSTKTLSSKDAPLGSGAPTTIKVETGSGADAKTVSVHIDGSNNTLEGIAKAMRDAGLDAKVVKQDAGYVLSLNGQTGAANTMRVSASGEPALQALFWFGADGSGGLRQTVAASDARVKVDGKLFTSSTNQLDKAIAGLTLNLGATGASEVKVTGDNSKIAANVKDFVKAFNTLGEQLEKAGGAQSPAGAIQAGIRGALAEIDPQQLAAIGISLTGDRLSVDGAKLEAAIAADPGKVNDLFGKSGSGLAARLVALVDKQIGSGGQLVQEARSLQADRLELQEQKAKVTETVNRQAALLMYQAEQSAAGAGTLLGGAGRPMSLFDILA